MSPTTKKAMIRRLSIFLLAALLFPAIRAGEAKRRWEMMNQIRREKFDLVLPEVMRENKVDLWITVMREGSRDPLHRDFGGGYVGDIGYYLFSDPGQGRVERVALGVSGYLLERGDAYDRFGPASELPDFVKRRDPQRIAVNMAERIGAADGLSVTMFRHLKDILGEPYGARLVSAEKLVSDFRSRRVASEIVAFGETSEISREIAERAFSNEVIVPGVTTLEDVAWWIMEELHRRTLDNSFGMPSVYVTGPQGIEAVSSDRIIQRGDLLMIDWGVGLMNFYNDMKRIAYVLREGETAPPEGLQNAFEQALKVREVVKATIKPWKSAAKVHDDVNQALVKAGFAILPEFNRPTDVDKTEVIIGCHSVGNLGHGVGPSIAFFNPTRLTYQLRPSNMLSIEFFAYTAADEWGGKKVRIPLEDDAIVTERGVEWLYPVIQKISLIK